MRQTTLRVLARNSPRALAAIIVTITHRRATVLAVRSQVTEDGEQIEVLLVLAVSGAGELDRLTRWLTRIVDVLAVLPEREFQQAPSLFQAPDAPPGTTSL